MPRNKSNAEPNGRITRRGLMGATAAGAVGMTILKPSMVRGAEANTKIKVGGMDRQSYQEAWRIRDNCGG